MAALIKSIEIISKHIKQNITKYTVAKQYSNFNSNFNSNSNKIITGNYSYNEVKTYEEILSIKYALGLTHFDESKIRDNSKTNESIIANEVNKINKINKNNKNNNAIRIAENPFCCNQCGNCSY